MSKKTEIPEDKFIDVEEIMKGKNPGLVKWTPGFFMRYLKRKIHEDEINIAMSEYKGANGYDFSKFVIDRFFIDVQIVGLENIPKTGGVYLASNHPLGGMDAMAIITEVYPYRQDFKFIVNDVLMNLENLKDMFVGVNKHGVNSKEALADLNNQLSSESATFLFPAGLVSRKKKGKVSDLEWKKTFITRARKFEKDVIPVFIDGNLSKFFYRLANFRTRIGIKANIEMLYLVDELFKQTNKKIKVRFGEPIPHETFDRSKKDIEWAQWVKSKVYELKTEDV